MTTLAGSTLAAVAVVALSCVISGTALLLARQAVLAGALLAAAGATGLGAVVTSGSGAPSFALPLLVAAGALLLPLALAAYPRLRWRHPVDLTALLVLGCGGLAVLVQPSRSAAVGPIGVILVGTLLAHTWWRLERTAGEERRAVQWMALAVGTACVVGSLVGFAWEGSVVSRSAVGVLVVVGPALWVGVRAPEVVDVRGVVVSAVVMVMTVLAYTAVFVGVATVLEIASGSVPEVGVLALVGALAATTIHPLQVLLRGVVDQLLLGARPDPLGAAHELAGHIGDDPEVALRSIRESLALPWASLRVGGTQVARSGARTPHSHVVVVDPVLGAELVVGLRAGDLSMPGADQQVLDLAAPLLAQTLRARALVEELNGARERTVSAIAEERRRLRRDLHDGLGPRLSGIAFASDAARNLVRSDPDTTEELLRMLRAETVTAIEEIRGLVDGMRPPALDELGLLGALRQQALGLRTSRGELLAVSVEAGTDLSVLPAAIEVAAYRIVVEALTNVGRHTGSATAAVTLDLEGERLRICVVDADGTPAHALPWTVGVGLSSMRDRAGELGGTVVAGPTPAGGRVEALLPVPA